MNTEIVTDKCVHYQKGVSTLVSMGTQVDTETLESPATEVPERPQVRGEDQALKITSVSNPTQVAVQTGALKPTSVGQQTSVPSSTRGSGSETPSTNAAGHQDSSVVLASQAAPKLHLGYTRLPNSILMRIASGELVRSEIQILLLIARFTISFSRRHAPLSKTVLERQTGLRGPAVLQAISELIAKGLIEKIPGDQYRPNLLGLKFDDDWDFFDPGERSTRRKPQAETAEGTPVIAETPVAQKTQVSQSISAPVPPATPAGVSAETYFKDNKTIENNNSLSALPARLRDYFSELKPERKRVSEWEAFQTLRAEYSDEDIADSFAILIERGVGESGARCHSPMAFLAKAMGDYLEILRTHRENLRSRAERDQRLADEQRRKVAESQLEQQEWAKKQYAFIRAYPNEEQQRVVLIELCRGLPFRPNSEAGRSFGISRWWEHLSDIERQALL